MDDRITKTDLPAPYRAADESSVAAQSTYLCLTRINLGALVLASLCGSVSISDPNIQRGLYMGAAACLLASIIVTLLVVKRRYRQRWYSARAAAESVKTLAWKYMCRSEPFEDDRSSSEVDRIFTQKMREVLSEGRDTSPITGGRAGTEPVITESMRIVRSSELQERLEWYLQERVRDQRAWYSRKAEESETALDWLSGGAVALQGLAMFAAVVLVAKPTVPITFIGPLSTAAAAVLAWLELNQHQELSEAYNVAAQELGFIEEQAEHVATEEELSEFIADAEAAISREHTMWIARRLSEGVVVPRLGQY